MAHGENEHQRVGTSPARAEAMLRAALEALGRSGALAPGLIACAKSLAKRLPSHYLPDVFLMQPLIGGGEEHAAFVLDATERNYLNHLSGGTYLRDAGVPDALGPECFDCVCGLVATRSHVRPFELHDTSFDSRDLRDPALFDCICSRFALDPDATDGPSALLRELACVGLRARVLMRDVSGRHEVAILPTKTSVRERFGCAPYRDAVRELLRVLGCDKVRLDTLDSMCATRAVRGYSVAYGLVDCVVLADVGCLAVRWEGERLAGVDVGVLVTDRLPSESGTALKPAIAYQWHITDECDQRCKHCYLFAEDARRRCITTPWDQLVRTLDEVERSAARRGVVPELAISGGDPILHPRFWDLAQEVHARGIRWTAMGNPFHLDEEACRRLRRLGCYQYQMSLDGLEEFHDSLRKPGSYAATLAALPLLNNAGVQTQLMATASRQNLDDILACMDVAASHGATSFAFARYCATSPKRAEELYPTAEEYRAFLLAYHRKKQAFERAGCRTRFKEKDHLFTLLRWELGEFEVPAWSCGNPGQVCGGCHLGAKCTIAANGDLLACRRMESVVGNIRRDRLWETDEGEAMAAFADPSRIEGCCECELVAWCRGCRAVGFNATGDLQASDPMCWHRPAARTPRPSTSRERII